MKKKLNKKPTKRQIEANIKRYNKAEAKRTAQHEKWKQLVIERKAAMYMKPTRFKHESGFRTFEVGYCRVSNGRVIEKYVHGMSSDHIYSDYGALIGYGKPPMLNMDCTLDGYIRMWGNEQSPVFWEEWALSSVGITTPELEAGRMKRREELSAKK